MNRAMLLRREAFRHALRHFWIWKTKARNRTKGARELYAEARCAAADYAFKLPDSTISYARQNVSMRDRRIATRGEI